MADYKTIHGIKVKSYTTDPDNPIDGQVWYDKTNKVLQFETPNLTTAGAFRTGGDINTPRQSGGGFGIQTSALMFGGTPPDTAATELYNGTSWTELNDLNAARQGIMGAGADGTSGIAIGGYPVTAATESWNGTSWTELNDLYS